jgi:four helix bundle protein
MKDWWFKDQIQRAWVSIMNNIAEWYEKPTNKDKVKFFSIAKWSCAEVRSMLHLWLKLGYFDEQLYQELTTKAYGLNKMIYNFTQKLD